jgi:hypothetical protein
MLANCAEGRSAEASAEGQAWAAGPNAEAVPPGIKAEEARPGAGPDEAPHAFPMYLEHSCAELAAAAEPQGATAAAAELGLKAEENEDFLALDQQSSPSPPRAAPAVEGSDDMDISGEPPAQGPTLLPPPPPLLPPLPAGSQACMHSFAP